MNDVDDDYAVAVDAAAAWPASPEFDRAGSPATRRLLSAMAVAAQRTGEVGPRDLAVLVRAALRAEHVRSGISKPITVPSVSPWPSAEAWREHSCDLISAAKAGVRLTAEPWIPDWLDVDKDPTADAVAGYKRAGAESGLEADPFFAAATGRAGYRTSGQRDAVRWLVNAAPGATLIANLPTGSGKSTVGYLPSLLRREGTTVFVVPTTSLALDQERAYRTLEEHRGAAETVPLDLAYFGEQALGVKMEIRRRVADGTQRIVFTSPEALMGGLSAAVFRAAERGLLSALVIDEAHVVAQWGAEFRPEFQALAGVREELLQVAARNDQQLFLTVLLSATLSQDTLDTLGGLFSRPGPAAVLSSVALRPEPSYWIKECGSEDERRRVVLETLRHVPRPAIVYLTRRSDAAEFYEVVRGNGFVRTALVSGNTAADSRRAAMHGLRNAEIDLVIATSAFGLGVDQPDVRAIIHACVPETIDRWYQEVGRGGRDGRSSFALLAAAPGDWQVARGLSRRRVITLEKGRDRWSAMRGRAIELKDGRWRVPLEVVPAHLDIPSRENQAWNVRTLLLLHRAGVISLEAEPPPKRLEGESDQEWEARVAEAFRAYSSQAVLRVLEPVESDEVWNRLVSRARTATLDADREAHEAMSKVVLPGARLCHLLQATYEIRRAVPGVEAELPVRVAPSCGGCPYCRANGLAPRVLVAPESQTRIGGGHLRWSSDVLRRRTAVEPLVVLVDRGRDRRSLRRCLERLAERGMRRLDPGSTYDMEPRLMQRLAERQVLIERSWTPYTPLAVPTVLLRTSDPLQPFEIDGAVVPRIVLVPLEQRDPRHATARVSDYHANVILFDDLMQQI